MKDDTTAWQTWQTTPTRPKASRSPWKRYLNEACPHGRRIALVNGTRVRNHYDSDFSQGGNGYRYKFIPKQEIWIDSEIAEEEWPFIAFHECREAERMKRGMSYEGAHDATKREEDRLRREALKSSPEAWLADRRPLCPVCGEPRDDVKIRKDPREWKDTFGLETFESCRECWHETRLDN